MVIFHSYVSLPEGLCARSWFAAKELPSACHLKQIHRSNPSATQGVIGKQELEPMANGYHHWAQSHLWIGKGAGEMRKWTCYDLHGRHATLQHVSLLQGFGYLGLDSQCTSLWVLMSWDIKDWSVNCLPIDGRKEDCSIWYITVAVLLFVGKSPLYGDCMASLW